MIYEETHVQSFSLFLLEKDSSPKKEKKSSCLSSVEPKEDFLMNVGIDIHSSNKTAEINGSNIPQNIFFWVQEKKETL